MKRRASSYLSQHIEADQVLLAAPQNLELPSMTPETSAVVVQSPIDEEQVKEGPKEESKLATLVKQ